MKRKSAVLYLFLLAIILFGNLFITKPVHASAASPIQNKYQVFLPLVKHDAPPPYYGLAMAYVNSADIRTLNVGWYYTWSDGESANIPAQFVPMSYYGLNVRQPKDYSGYMLVFNEPNNPQPWGCDLAPAEAARRYGELRQQYPQAKLVVGGWSVFSKDWIEGFVSELEKLNIPLPEYWHVHAYIEAWVTPAVAQQNLAFFHDLTGGTYWITEFSSLDGNLADFQNMTNWFENQKWISRIGAYTNRQPPDADWAINSNVELINSGGNLNTIGAFYSNQASKGNPFFTQ